MQWIRTGLFLACSLLCADVATAQVPGVPAEKGGAAHEFTITAGNAFFDATPVLGAVCTFDFGDPAGAYNFLTGYNAAHIYEKAGTYQLKVGRIGEPDAVKTIHVLPDKRKIQRLAAGDSILEILRAVPNDTVVLLPPGVTWDLNGPVEMKASNVAIRAAGPGPAPRIRRIAATGSSSLILHGLDITFRGIEFDTDRDMKSFGNIKVNYRGITPDTAHVVVQDCTFRNFDDDIFCTPLTRGLLAQHCTFTEETRSCDIWADGSNLVVLGNKMGTSQREHNIRQSHPGFFNLLVFDNDIFAMHGKETLTFRIGQDLYAAHNAFHGWVRTGPGPRGDHRPISPEELKTAFVKYVVLERNAFLDGAFIQINEGSSEITLRYNRLDVDNKNVTVHVQGPSVNNLVLEGNYRVLTAGPTEKPVVRAYETGPQDIVERESTIKTGEEAEKLKGK